MTKKNDSTCIANGQQKMRERREARLHTACCSASLAATLWRPPAALPESGEDRDSALQCQLWQLLITGTVLDSAQPTNDNGRQYRRRLEEAHNWSSMMTVVVRWRSGTAIVLARRIEGGCNLQSRHTRFRHTLSRSGPTCVATRLSFRPRFAQNC
jgi:hypothetical protein